MSLPAIAGAILIATVGWLAATLESRGREPVPFVSAKVDSVPCSWPRIVEHRASTELTCSGSAGRLDPGSAISGTIMNSAVKNGVAIEQTGRGAMSRPVPIAGEGVDRLRLYRYEGVPRFSLARELTPGPQPGVVVAHLTVPANALGPYGAITMEPEGRLIRLIDRPQFDTTPGTTTKARDGSYVIDVSINHRGWNGFVFLESSKPVPAHLIETSMQSASDIRRFKAMAEDGGYKLSCPFKAQVLGALASDASTGSKRSTCPRPGVR